MRCSLYANEAAGTTEPGVTPDDVLLAVAGLWPLDPSDDWTARARRVLDFAVARPLRRGTA